jgi:hypothetical protein
VLLQGDAMAFNLSQHISKNPHERADHKQQVDEQVYTLFKAQNTPGVEENYNRKHS